jgi:hypothetical protein
MDQIAVLRLFPCDNRFEMTHSFNSSALSFRHRTWLLMAGYVLLLAACSSVRFGYNHADTFLVSSLDRYLDLENGQKQLAERQAEAFLAWHRATQLNDYAALLEEARVKIRGPVTVDDVLAFQWKLMNRLAAIGERAAPEIARLALTLTPEQIAHLRSELADDEEEFREKYEADGADGIAKAQAKRFIKVSRFWFETLTPAQEEIVRAGFAGRDRISRFWMEERERRQRDLVAVLDRIRSEHPAPGVAAGWVRDYFAGFVQHADPQQRASAQAQQRSNADLIAKLINAATPEQRAELDEKLERYANDFTALAMEGGRYLPTGNR